MKRIFFAIDINPAGVFREMLKKVRLDLANEAITWVKTDRLHITLAFLGDKEDQLIDALASVISKELHQKGQLTLKLSSLGVFRNIHDPHILWTGCQVSPPLLQVKEDLDRLLEPFGYTPEYKTFTPHVTLGRIRNLANRDHLKLLLSHYRDVQFQEETVQEVVLYESYLRPGGPQYLPLHVFSL
jgi:2'-5' RNA ligase